MSSANPLTESPFTLIPGIDPSAPISEQIEQVDQLNTLLLQEIDANFAKFHTVITSKILPDIKRFAIASEPTRGATKFWRSFFERASDIRLSNIGDTTTTDESQRSLPTDEAADETIRENDEYLSRVQDEGSFIFDRGGHVSSTPLSGDAARAARQVADESWDDSLESPFDRVERQLHGLNLREDSSDAPTPSLPSGYSLPAIPNRSLTESPELPPNSFNAGLVNDSMGSPDSLEMTPKAPSRTVPRPQSQQQPQSRQPQSNANPFSTTQWNGIADLRTTPLNAFKVKGKGRAPKPSLANTIDELRAMDAMDQHELAMSPPVTMTWNLPPRAQGIFNVGRTPVKGSSGARSSKVAGGARGQQEEVGARRILDDLMEEMQQGYEPSPRMPTPDGLGRYSIMPSDLNGVGKRLFEPEIKAGSSSHPAGGRARPSASRATRRSMANTSFGSDILDEAPDQPTPINEDDSYDGDEPSIESTYGATTLHNMEGINMGGDLLGDESMMSSPGGGVDGQTQRSEAGMVFGSNESGEREPRVPGKTRGTLSLYKVDEMSTFHGGKLLDAAGGEVRHSPIAAVRGEQGRDLFTGKK